MSVALLTVRQLAFGGARVALRRGMATASGAMRKIAFVTDVEGNLEYWNHQVAHSQCLRRDRATGELNLLDDSYFVFGGDCFDKGSGDMQISAELVALKKRYPSRVYLLLGNRDVNKMRFRSELDPSELARDPASFPPSFWMPANSNATYANWLNGRDGHAAINKLHFMTEHTMGAPHLLSYAREGLAKLRGVSVTAISDGDLVTHFRDAIRPGGHYYEYIAAGQLAVCLGTTLFVHGAATAKSIGFVPAPETRYGLYEVRGDDLRETHSVVDWVSRLNAWKREQWSEFARAPLPPPCTATTGLQPRRGGEGLMGYAHSKALDGRTVMVSSFCTAGEPWQSNLAPPDQGVADYLNRSGIHRIVTGHKPFGDSPALVRTPGLEVVCADTSYSDPAAPDSRGAAYSEVCIVDNCTHISGYLRDGRAIAFDMPPAPHCLPVDKQNPTRDGDPFIGKRTPDHWWIKARLQHDPTTYIGIRAKGFVVEYKDFAAADLSFLLG